MATKPVFSERNLEGQIRAFLRTELQGIQDAAGIAIKAGASRFTTLMRQQARAAFRETEHGGSKSFPKSFKAYHVKPRSQLGYASYVRSGVPFMGVFETGHNYNPGKTMIVRLEGALNLGLPRHNKTTQLNHTLDQLRAQYGKGAIAILNNRKGPIIALRTSKRIKGVKGGMILLYQLRKTVRVGKRLDFFKLANTVAGEIPNNIQRIIR